MSLVVFSALNLLSKILFGAGLFWLYSLIGKRPPVPNCIASGSPCVQKGDWNFLKIDTLQSSQKPFRKILSNPKSENAC